MRSLPCLHFSVFFRLFTRRDSCESLFGNPCRCAPCPPVFVCTLLPHPLKMPCIAVQRDYQVHRVIESKLIGRYGDGTAAPPTINPSRTSHRASQPLFASVCARPEPSQLVRFLLPCAHARVCRPRTNFPIVEQMCLVDAAGDVACQTTPSPALSVSSHSNQRPSATPRCHVFVPCGQKGCVWAQENRF